MTVNNGQQVTRTSQDFVPFEVPKDFKLPDNGLGGPNGGQTTTVSAADLSDALKEQDIYGPRTVNPLDSSSPGDPSDKGTTPANPDAPYILTAEPEAKSSAIGEHLANLSEKPVFEEKKGWVGAGDRFILDKNKDGTSVLFDTKTFIMRFYDKDGQLVVTNYPNGTAKWEDPSMQGGSEEDELAPIPTPKPKTDGGTSDAGSYVNPEADTRGGNHSLPDIDGMLSSGKSTPSGDAMGLGQFKSGGSYDFKAMESKLENLLGIGTSSKGSGEQGGSTGIRTNTVSDGSSGGSSGDIKSAAPSGGGSVAPPTGLEALMQKFGMDGFNAHLKDGSFDLDNFSAGAPSTKGPILDLDGNGQQDIIEWALGQVVSEKADVAIVEEFHSNPALAEFHQMMMDKYADVFIA